MTALLLSVEDPLQVSTLVRAGLSSSTCPFKTRFPSGNLLTIHSLPRWSYPLSGFSLYFIITLGRVLLWFLSFAQISAFKLQNHVCLSVGYFHLDVPQYSIYCFTWWHHHSFRRNVLVCLFLSFSFSLSPLSLFPHCPLRTCMHI